MFVAWREYIKFQWALVECILGKKRKIVEVGGESAVGRLVVVAFGQGRSIEATI